MSAGVFLRHTTVYWTKWSSSRPPCGLGLESPNLFVASSTWRHEATSGFIPLLQLQGYITVVVCMIMIVKIFLLDSNMITRVSDASPCIYFYTSIYVSTLLVVFLLRLVPFCTWNSLHQGTTDPYGSDCIPMFHMINECPQL